MFRRRSGRHLSLGRRTFDGAAAAATEFPQISFDRELTEAMCPASAQHPALHEKLCSNIEEEKDPVTGNLIQYPIDALTLNRILRREDVVRVRAFSGGPVNCFAPVTLKRLVRDAEEEERPFLDPFTKDPENPFTPQQVTCIKNFPKEIPPEILEEEQAEEKKREQFREEYFEEEEEESEESISESLAEQFDDHPGPSAIVAYIENHPEVNNISTS